MAAAKEPEIKPLTQEPTRPKEVIPQVQKPIMTKMPENKLKSTLMPVAIGVLVVITGIATGWFTASPRAGSESGSVKMASSVSSVGDKENSDEAGIADEESDTAEGTLKEGGIDGEGTHYLDRDAGPDKYVYLTSTVLNLDSFEGKKIQVWGDTMAGRSAGWLMDVTKVKVIE
jgi:hypothetical protein